MNNRYWTALRGSHFAESQIFLSVVSIGCFLWFQTIALCGGDLFYPSSLSS